MVCVFNNLCILEKAKQTAFILYAYIHTYIQNWPLQPFSQDCLTITQRIKMIQTYYKNGDSGVLRGDYGLHNRATTQFAKL